MSSDNKIVVKINGEVKDVNIEKNAPEKKDIKISAGTKTQVTFHKSRAAVKVSERPSEVIERFILPPKLESKVEPAPKIGVRAKPTPTPKIEEEVKPSSKVGVRPKPTPKVEGQVKPTPKIGVRAKPTPKIEEQVKPTPKIVEKAISVPKIEEKVAPPPEDIVKAIPKVESTPRIEGKAEHAQIIEIEIEKTPKIEMKAEPVPIIEVEEREIECKVYEFPQTEQVELETKIYPSTSYKSNDRFSDLKLIAKRLGTSIAISLILGITLGVLLLNVFTTPNPPANADQSNTTNTSGNVVPAGNGVLSGFTVKTVQGGVFTTEAAAKDYGDSLEPKFPYAYYKKDLQYFLILDIFAGNENVTQGMNQSFEEKKIPTFIKDVQAPSINLNGNTSEQVARKQRDLLQSVINVYSKDELAGTFSKDTYLGLEKDFNSTQPVNDKDYSLFIKNLSGFFNEVKKVDNGVVTPAMKQDLLTAYTSYFAWNQKIVNEE